MSIITLNGIRYTDLVPRDYRFNPKTEELIYGDELADGMMVLTDSLWQGAVDDIAAKTVIETNRWCMVTKIRMEDSAIFFVGVYNDGHMAIRQSSVTDGWYVKRHEWELVCYPGECLGESCIRIHTN